MRYPDGTIADAGCKFTLIDEDGDGYRRVPGTSALGIEALLQNSCAVAAPSFSKNSIRMAYCCPAVRTIVPLFSVRLWRVQVVHERHAVDPEPHAVIARRVERVGARHGRLHLPRPAGA